MLYSSKSLYAAIEQEFRKVGRGIRSGKGGSRQRQYFCDQRVVGESGAEEGCTARVRATRQVTNEFKVTFVDTEHVNCAGSTTTATIRGMEPVLTAALRNNPKISDEALMKTVENSTGATMTARSITRAKSMLMQADHKAGSDTFKQLRPYLAELQAHSPGTVTSVEVSQWIPFLSLPWPYITALFFAAKMTWCSSQEISPLHNKRGCNSESGNSPVYLVGFRSAVPVLGTNQSNQSNSM